MYMHNMLTVYKSFRKHQSGNVGDKLIGESAVNIFKQITNQKIIGYFDEESLLNDLDVVNSGRGLIIPAFPIRDQIWRYKLTKKIENSEIKVPVIPFAVAWSDFPGDYNQILNKTYPGQNPGIEFASKVFKNSNIISAREYNTKKVIEKMGFQSKMIGDPAWYEQAKFGKEMEQPKKIDKLVVTDPHQVQYYNQTLNLMKSLSEEFPNAEKYFSFHGSLDLESNKLLESKINDESLNYEIIKSSHDTDNLEIYEQCDLHVGYRVHGHLSFLRKRIPSVLLIEDGRGLGFSKTFGTGGFKAYKRLVYPKDSQIKSILKTFPEGFLNYLKRKSGNNTSPHPLYPPSKTINEEVIDFINQELDNDWSRYQHIPNIIDGTYNKKVIPIVDQISDLPAETPS